MHLSKHISKAIEDYEKGDMESALMNACIGISSTSTNLYGDDKSKNYKRCINEHIWIIEAMMSVRGACLNLEKIVWGNIEIDNGYGKLIVNPTLADVIYHVFRCADAHGQQVPKNYELIPVENGEVKWQIGNKMIRMPEQIIPALLAVSIFSKKNTGDTLAGDYYISLGEEKFIINDWWGKEDEFKVMLSKNFPKPNRVDLKELDLMMVKSLPPKKFIDVLVKAAP